MRTFIFQISKYIETELIWVIWKQLQNKFRRLLQLYAKHLQAVVVVCREEYEASHTESSAISISEVDARLDTQPQHYCVLSLSCHAVKNKCFEMNSHSCQQCQNQPAYQDSVAESLKVNI